MLIDNCPTKQMNRIPIETSIWQPIFKASITFFAALSALISYQDSIAASQLMVAPTRIVFDGNTRSSKVTLINSGDETGTYRISVVNKRMTVDGKFEDVDSPNADELVADKMIRYSPRQVVLEPGKSQVVRLSLRKPAKLENGEYRSHLLFKAIPKDAGTDISSLTQSDKISIKLTPIVSITIPVIVRHGKTNATAKISKVDLIKEEKKTANKTEPRPALLLEIERTGNASIYGDVFAEFVRGDGAGSVVAQINGIAIYTPNKLRKVKIPLNTPSGVTLKNGIIRVFYRSPANQGGKVISQSQIKIP